MKAWQVYSNDGASTIVFAETRGKAKYIAQQWIDGFEDYNFTEIICYRKKDADGFYNGKDCLDWLNDNDRLILVKEFGFACHEDYYEEDDCVHCSAKEYCRLYAENAEEEV